MLNLLSKFDEIKIENVNRIDEEDKKFCEMFNKIYSETLVCYKNILYGLITLYNEQIMLVENSYDLSISKYAGGRNDLSIDGVKNGILHTKENLISKLCHYFSRKYNVTIDHSKIYERYKDIELPYGKQENRDKTLNINLLEYVHIDYNIILDEIFVQMGGHNFLEKAIDEIKKKAIMPLRWYEYRKYWNYEVKGKTIKFRTSIDDIKPTLYFYDNNETQLIDCYTHNKVDDYTSYENGNTNIKFINASYALDFAKRFLGYIEMTEEQREAFKKSC